jgi:hypothetical protein
MAGSLSLYAQEIVEETNINQQFWADYHVSNRLSEQWELYGNIGFRTISPYEWNRFVVSPAIGFRVPKMVFKQLKYREELHAGIGLFYTRNFNVSNRLELRLFQGYKLDWPDRPRLRIRHYLRLEERFEFNTETWKSTFGLRFRYLAELTIRLQGDLLKYNKGVYLPINLELFWNLIGTRQFNDQARLNFGVGKVFSEKWRGEFDLGYHYSRNTTQDDFTNNNLIYRLRVFYRID